MRYFLAVANTRSFSRAAELIHLTQPTLSHQIKQLEARLGTILFERSTKNVALTTAGQLFKPYCERILNEIESSKLALSALEGLMRGTLRIAVFHSFSQTVLPPILSEFALRYPGVRVTARVVPRLDMERELIDAELDMALAYVTDDNEQIIAERLFDEELVLVAGTKSSLAKRKSVPMRDLVMQPLVLLTPEFGARQFVDRFFAGTGTQPHVVLETNAIEPILATIRHTGLASVLSAGAVVDMKGLRIVRLTTPPPRRTVGILWRRHGHRSAAAQRMADMIKEVYGRKSPPKRAPRRTGVV